MITKFELCICRALHFKGKTVPGAHVTDDFPCKSNSTATIRNSLKILMHAMSHIDGLVQERCNSIANAMELRLSCTNPSIYASLSRKKFNSFGAVTASLSCAKFYNDNYKNMRVRAKQNLANLNYDGKFFSEMGSSFGSWYLIYDWIISKLVYDMVISNNMAFWNLFIGVNHANPCC